MSSQILTLLQMIRPEANFESSADFVKDALLDSLDIILLVNEIEMAFGIKIPGQQVVAANFNSVGAIEKLVKSLK